MLQSLLVAPARARKYRKNTANSTADTNCHKRPVAACYPASACARKPFHLTTLCFQFTHHPFCKSWSFRQTAKRKLGWSASPKWSVLWRSAT